jgi:RNA polymerase sigma-70 factor (ECF subfamily)
VLSSNESGKCSIGPKADKNCRPRDRASVRSVAARRLEALGGGLIQVEPSDEELCSRIAARDADAFELMVDRHQARAYRLAASILGNEADARDVSQDAFIRLYESAGSFDGRSRFSTWFYRILVNLCIDNQRRNKWWRRLVPLASPGDDTGEHGVDPPSSELGPESVAMLTESISRVRPALAMLSPQQRAAVLLQTQEGFTSREIAAVLKCSENTARVHVHRAIARLRRLLKND